MRTLRTRTIVLAVTMLLLFVALLKTPTTHVSLAVAAAEDERQLPSLDYTLQRFGAGTWYSAIQLVDMDGDDMLEVVIGNREQPALEIWRYEANERSLRLISSISLPCQVHDTRAADMDGDGDMDAVVGMRGCGLYFIRNTGTPSTIGPWSIEEVDYRYSWQVLVEDFDGDGHLDIFDGLDYGPIALFYGDGEDGFVEGAFVTDPTTAMRFPRGFDAVDLNGDDRPDLIGTDGSFMRAFINPGDRTTSWLSVGPDAPLGDYPCCDYYELQSNISPSAGDLDGDGTIDKVAFLGTPGSADDVVDLLLWWGNGDEVSPSWNRIVLDTITGSNFAGHIGVADVDGDGHLDIHVGGYSFFPDLLVYLGNGQGSFTSETVTLGHGVGGMNSLAVGDVNGDGYDDIVTSRNVSGLYDDSDGFEVLFREVRDPPITSPDSYVTRLNTMLRVPAPGVLANDIDPDGEPLTATVVTRPGHGWLSLDPDGAFVYFPDYGFTGEDSFVYEVRSATGETAQGNVTLHIWPHSYLFRLMAIFR